MKDKLFDAKNQEILARRKGWFESHQTPQVGDFVRFSDGVERRISYRWHNDTFQTSDGGSFYIGDDWVSFSGALYSSIPGESMKRAEEKKLGDFWFFDRNLPGAGHAVNVTIFSRVWDCNLRSQEGWD